MPIIEIRIAYEYLQCFATVCLFSPAFSLYSGNSTRFPLGWLRLPQWSLPPSLYDPAPSLLSSFLLLGPQWTGQEWASDSS